MKNRYIINRVPNLWKNLQEVRKMKKLLFVIGVFFFLFFISLQPALANKSTVTLEGPESAVKGTEVTIKINITHSANSFMHYTNWVKVEANGKLIQEWKYSVGDRPESANFTKEVQIKIAEDTEITAQANCNLHGSAGPAKLVIRAGDSRANP